MKKTAFTLLIGMVLGIGGFLLWHPAGQPGEPLPPAIIENVQAFILPVSQASYSPVRDFNIAEPDMKARAVLLIDAKSNRVLYAKNAEARLPIASITKLMSAMVILDHLDLGAMYEVSAEDRNLDGMGADFARGEKFLGADLFKIMLVKSSNDAVSVFATTAYRQGLNFVGLMNEKAKALGMANTHFDDPAGLSDADTYSTATDVITMLRAAEAYPLIGEALRSKEISITSEAGKGYRAINTDQLLSTLSGIILGKTGNTTGAKGTLTLAVRVGDREDTLLAVVLGSDQRFVEMANLIAWGKKAHSWEQP
ncbi:MAG: serine hydrolase [Patescibacteria group bacterium]